MTLRLSILSMRSSLESISQLGACGILLGRHAADLPRSLAMNCGFRSLVEVARIPRDGLFEIEAIASVA